MNKSKTWLSHLAMLFVVSQFIVGCHLLSDFKSERPHTTKTIKNDNLVDYYLWLNKLTNEQITSEYQQNLRLGKEQQQAKLKLMLIQSLPKKDFYNPKQALADYKKRTVSLTEQEQLLLDLLARQLQTQISLDQALAVAQKKQMKVNKQLKKQKAAIDSLKTENLLLQSQIAQLKQIENSININGQ
ncbi:hypothetical protein [Psychrosphaera sp. I2R16]|uniref:hypothetical protein n=1 Tax=Psychrosphaera sp. I2R16 TaxID=2841558 RepID=UPI001C0A2D67|nr:hypothetical protein [Psychrosphaera sp. I2R16]